jgi:hypothetical protein
MCTLGGTVESRRWSKFYYNQGLSEKLGQVCKQYDISMASKSQSSLKDFLPKTNDFDNRKLGSGVYFLSCNDCNARYVGQTGVAFIKRFKEHYAAICNGKPESSHFAEHILNTGHDKNVNFDDNCKILYNEDNRLKRCFVEACYIKQVSENEHINLVNHITSPVKSSLVKFAVDLKISNFKKFV